MKRVISGGIGIVAILFFQGCAHKAEVKQIPLIKQVEAGTKVCSRLKSPQFLSFKQVAFAVAKKEGVKIGDIKDFYFYDKKFKSNWFYNIPDLKLQLERKHNATIKILNYAVSNRDVTIIALDKNKAAWFNMAQKETVNIEAGQYRLEDIYNQIKDMIGIDISSKFYDIPIIVKKKREDISLLDVINLLTINIAKKNKYDFVIQNGKLKIFPMITPLIVNFRYMEAFMDMLNRQSIFYQKTENAFVIRDNLSNFWYAKEFLHSLNYSEDQFNFCADVNGKDTYGSFTGNDKVVLKGIGKVQLIDYGLVKNGKLKYKLKIENLKNKSVQEYIIYSDKDTFTVQLDNKSVLKIKLY